MLAILDICGAMSLKTIYKNVSLIYVKRDKRSLLRSILEKDCSNEDKVSRIISIDDERQNEDLCDYAVRGNSPAEAATDILAYLGIKK